MQLWVIINCAYTGRVSQVSTLPLYGPGIDDCCWGRLPLDSQKSILLSHDLDSLASLGAANCLDAFHVPLSRRILSTMEDTDALQLLAYTDRAVDMESVFG